MATKKKKAKKTQPAARKTAKKKTVAKAKAPAKKRKALAKVAPPPKKAKAKATAKAKAKAATKKPTTPKAAAPRRDATGHLNPKYARDLRARSRENRDDVGDTRAFLRRGLRSKDDLAEELGEEAVASMTSGADQSDRFDQEVDEEKGGPFIETRARVELARGTDKSNPRDATREPFPTS